MRLCLHEQSIRLLLNGNRVHERVRWHFSLLREVMLVLIGCTFSDSLLSWLESVLVQKKGKLVAGKALQHLTMWLVLQGFNQVLCCWLNQFTVHTANITFHHHGVQSKYLWSLSRISHLSFLSGSSGCRCLEASQSSSIKGIFTFTGTWFLQEPPRLRLTITNLSIFQHFITLIHLLYNQGL